METNADDLINHTFFKDLFRHWNFRWASKKRKNSIFEFSLSSNVVMDFKICFRTKYWYTLYHNIFCVLMISERSVLMLRPWARKCYCEPLTPPQQIYYPVSLTTAWGLPNMKSWGKVNLLVLFLPYLYWYSEIVTFSQLSYY